MVPRTHGQGHESHPTEAESRGCGGRSERCTCAVGFGKCHLERDAATQNEDRRIAQGRTRRCQSFAQDDAENAHGRHRCNGNKPTQAKEHRKAFACREGKVGREVPQRPHAIGHGRRSAKCGQIYAHQCYERSQRDQKDQEGGRRTPSRCHKGSGCIPNRYQAHRVSVGHTRYHGAQSGRRRNWIEACIHWRDQRFHCWRRENCRIPT
mmetsp:Transcript_3986/g.25098  ORF Transcript_3986/g.25098 Transcript_3986/m.25098 type:complete len:208 (-) Transcript_3986:1124-1747(-)